MYTMDGPYPGSLLSSFESRLRFLFGVISDVSGTSETWEEDLGKSCLGVGATAPKQIES